MDKYIIQGLNPLKGEIKVGGSKNAALPIIAASLLADSEVVLDDIPRLRDVTNLCSIIEDMGAKVIRDKNRIEIDLSLIHI